MPDVMTDRATPVAASGPAGVVSAEDGPWGDADYDAADELMTLLRPLRRAGRDAVEDALRPCREAP